MQEKEKNQFSLPDQVRQMGAVDKTLRIYVEDYVYSYLKEFCRGDRERLAVLCGRQMMVDGEKTLIIHGAIGAKYTVQDHGAEAFTEESRTYVKEQMEAFFPGMQVVGWCHAQPGFGIFLSARDALFYQKIAPEGNQVLLLIDPQDKQEAFFYPKNGETLGQADGFFVFYERNREMQDYMVESRQEPEPEEEELHLDPVADIRKVMKRRKKKAKRSNVRDTALAGLSAVFCAACLAMSVNVYQSRSQLAQLEDKVVAAETMAQAALQAQSAEANAPITKEDLPVPVVVKEAEPDAVAVTAPAEAPVVAQTETPAAAQTETGTTAALPEEESIPVWYTVEEGDTLLNISMEYYDTVDMVEEIMAINGITDPNRIYYGRELMLPSL